MSSDEAQYSAALPFLKKAAVDLGERIRDALKALGDPYLVRANLQSHRIKELSSLKRKAAQQGWTIDEAFQRAADLVGYRVVCNNLQDVERAVELIEDSFKSNGTAVERRDYVKSPQKAGYRAVHLWIRMPVVAGEEKMVVGCEVQIRSLLQHSWGELSRADIYTMEQSFDPLLLRSMERLSELLHVADQIANDIREQISRPRPGKQPEHGAPLTSSAIAFLFRRAFDEDPPDYVVEATVREFVGTLIRSDGLEMALKDEKLLEKLRSAYRKYFNWEPDSAQLFRWVVHAVARGIKSAVKLAKKEGREDWQEVDAGYRSDVLSGLPEAWQELVSMIEHPGKDEDFTHDILRWADVFGALDRCFCGEKIVQSDALAEALVDHYELQDDEADEAHQAIELAVFNSGVETGSWNHPSMCNYHAYVMSKDD